MNPWSTVLRVLTAATLLGLIGCNGNGDGGGTSANVGAECTSARASLEASCAAGMGDIFECWDPSGGCELEGLGVTFDSGARYEGSVTGLDGRYINSAGQTCGSFEVTSTDTSTGSVSADFVNQTGETFTLSNNGSGDVTIGCPGGDSVTLTKRDQQALQACSAPIELCENSGNPGDFPDDAFGECTRDDECPDVDGVTLVCCDFDGQGLCQVREVCELLEDDFGSCTNDSECPNIGGLNWVCCDIFGVRSCVPEDGCG